MEYTIPEVITSLIAVGSIVFNLGMQFTEIRWLKNNIKVLQKSVLTNKQEMEHKMRNLKIVCPSCKDDEILVIDKS